MKKPRIRESIHKFGDKETQVRDIKFLQDESMLTLNYPKEEFHYHHWFDREIKGHIKNEITGKREKANKKPNEIRDERISFILLNQR